MKVQFSLLLMVLCLFSACSDDTDKEAKRLQIKEMEAKLINETSGEMDEDLSTIIVKAYVDFAEKYTVDGQTPDYLFKAGEISMNLNNGAQAMAYFSRVAEQYPDYEKVPYCIFLQAFIYETQLNNMDKAKEYYTKFIHDFPNHDFVNDAKISIQNLGKPLEEIIKGFENKNQTDSVSDGS